MKQLISGALLLVALQASAQAENTRPMCRVVDGMVADLALGPYLPSTETVTLKASDKVEFRWELSDKESTGWMRISNASGVELGWVPAGHEAVTCGKSD